MNREEVIQEVENIIEELTDLDLSMDSSNSIARKIIDFLDDIGYDSSTELGDERWDARD